jgi:hypothetical protein
MDVERLPFGGGETYARIDAVSSAVYAGITAQHPDASRTRAAAAATAATGNPPIARHAVAGDAGARSVIARRHGRRLLDARPSATHRAEQSAVVD